MSDAVYRSIVEGDDDAYYAVVISQAQKLAASGRMRHPDGRSWVPDDAFELASDYWLSPAFAAVLISATDDDSLNALIYTALHNQVINKSRGDDRSRLRRRLKAILRSGPYVQGPTAFWRRQTDSPNAYCGPRTELLEAAWSTEVNLIRWSPKARRNSPVAEGASFTAVLDAVFAVAGGAVDEGDLLDVLAHRFGVGPVSIIEALDQHEDRVASDESDNPEDQVVARENHGDAVVQAVELFRELSPDEQRMLALASASARDAADTLGIGKTKANGIQSRLRRKLALRLGGKNEEQRREILTELQRLADARTVDDGSTS